MNVKELITQLLNEDMDADIGIEVGTNTVRDYVEIDGIVNNMRSKNGVLIVPVGILHK